MTTYTTRLRQPTLVWALMSTHFVSRAGGVARSLLVLYLTQERQLSPTTAGAVIAAVGVGDIGSQLLGGWLSDRIGRRHTMLVGFLGTAVALVALGSAARTRIPSARRGLAEQHFGEPHQQPQRIDTRVGSVAQFERQRYRIFHQLRGVRRSPVASRQSVIERDAGDFLVAELLTVAQAGEKLPPVGGLPVVVRARGKVRQIPEHDLALQLGAASNRIVGERNGIRR